ncbi:hypothetical protein BH20ACI3_BH20ACI3_17700 [soil metagenome]
MKNMHAAPNRFDLAIVTILCVIAVVLLLSIPAQSLDVNLVYKGF